MRGVTKVWIRCSVSPAVTGYGSSLWCCVSPLHTILGWPPCSNTCKVATRGIDQPRDLGSNLSTIASSRGVGTYAFAVVFSSKMQLDICFKVFGCIQSSVGFHHVCSEGPASHMAIFDLQRLVSRDRGLPGKEYRPLKDQSQTQIQQWPTVKMGIDPNWKIDFSPRS